MHGLTPGPALFQNKPDFVWAVIASMFIGNAILLIMNLPMARMWGYVAAVPAKMLYPAIVVVSVLGAYSVSGSEWDIWIMLIFGVLGFLMKKLDIPMAPLVLTFVLGKMMESSMSQSLLYFKGDFMGFFLRPISGTMLVLAIVLLILAVVAGYKGKRKMLAGDAEV